MNLQDLYKPEIEFENGDIRNSCGNLQGAVRVSFIPLEGSNLPRHDLVGVKFEKRFMRYFKRVNFGGADRSAFFETLEQNLSDDRKAAREARDKSGNKPEIIPSPVKSILKSDECVQIVICDNFRFHIKHSDGTVLVTLKDYELYL